MHEDQEQADGRLYGVGASIEIELASGRLFELDLKTCDKEWATLADFSEALAIAARRILEPIEG